MSRPVLLRVEGIADIGGFVERCAREIGVQFAGIEYAIRDSLPAPGLPAGLHPRTRFDGDDGCGIMAISALCREVRLDAAVEIVSRLLREASASGAVVMNLALPGSAAISGTSELSGYQDVLNFAYQLLRAVRFDAESVGVVVAVEAAHSGRLLSPVEARELIDAVNSWAVGTCIDVDRLGSAGASIDWLRTLTHRVKAVRSRVAGERGQWPELMNSLDGIGFDGPLIIVHELTGAER